MTDLDRPLNKAEFDVLRQQLATHELFRRYMNGVLKATGDAILDVATAEPNSVTAAEIQNLNGRYAMLVELNRKLTEAPDARTNKRRIRSSN